MKNSPFRLTSGFLLILMVLTTLSCKTLSRVQPPTATPVPVSSQAVEDLVENVQSAAETAAAGGPATLIITQEQLTSLVALQLQSVPDLQIQNLQILLQDGQIQVSGEIKQDNITLPVSIALAVTVNEQGQPQTRVVSAKLGPLPVPEAALTEITSQIDQMIVSQFSANAGNLVIESITISDGYMTIIGHLQ